MSKNKKTTKNVYDKPTKAEIKKAKTKKVILAVIAAIVTIAVAAAAAVLIKNTIEKKNFEKINAAVTYEYETLAGSENNEKYNYVDYSGAVMPEEFARILNQAALDSEKACQSGGVAVSLGERQISAAEFRMYYYEVALEQYQEAFYLEETKGYNASGFDYYTDPASQKYLQEDITWEEHLVDKTTEKLKIYYSEFERACNAKTRLPEETVSETVELLQQIEAEDFVSNYGEGATYEIYAAKYIMQLFSEEFFAKETEKLSANYSEEFVLQKYKESGSKYQVADIRVYPLEGDFDSNEVASIKTEKQFLDFAEKNYREIAGDAQFNIDKRTYLWCASHTTVANRYGGTVADWIFDDARKAGDISLQEGAAYKCLIYIEKPKYESFSSDIVYVDIPYNTLSTAEEQKKTVEALYSEWQKGEATAQSLEAAFANLGTVESLGARTGDFATDADMWIHNESRKNGDSSIFFTDEGAYIFLFIKENPEDYDWEPVLRTELAMAEYEEKQKASIDDKFSSTKKNNDIIEAAADAANAQLALFVESYKGKKS